MTRRRFGCSSSQHPRTQTTLNPEVPTTAPEAERAAIPVLIGFPGGPTDRPEVKRDQPRGMIYAARVLAATRVDLFEDRAAREAIKAEFRRKTEGSRYRPLIPEGPPMLART
jgi:hypothetical protein